MDEIGQGRATDSQHCVKRRAVQLQICGLLLNHNVALRLNTHVSVNIYLAPVAFVSCGDSSSIFC